jgi:hypothetical protein
LKMEKECATLLEMVTQGCNKKDLVSVVHIWVLRQNKENWINLVAQKTLQAAESA